MREQQPLPQYVCALQSSETQGSRLIRLCWMSRDGSQRHDVRTPSGMPHCLKTHPAPRSMQPAAQLAAHRPIIQQRPVPSAQQPTTLCSLGVQQEQHIKRAAP